MTNKEEILAEIERLKSFYVRNVNEEYRDFTILLLNSVVDNSINPLPAEQQKQRINDKACEWLNKNMVEYHP